MQWREIGSSNDEELVKAARDRAIPLTSPESLKPLVAGLAERQVVMLGEASHGTQEFYEWRRYISQQLIEKHDFRFIAVEGDWPPAWQLNKYVHGEGGMSARQVLRAFDRWPTWMWANTEVIKLAEWMREHNSSLPLERKVGFYGLDVYSLFESISSILEQLGRINPFLAKRAKIQYGCFDPFFRDERAYARSLLEFPPGCEAEVSSVLRDLLQQRMEGAVSPIFGDALFNAQQNARIVANAEQYYRTMVHGREDAWNVRDQHMFETLGILHGRYGLGTKSIVWAHNTHIGDYRATDMPAQGQVNLGGLARESWGEEKVALVGLGTYRGSVIASHAWDGPTDEMMVPPGRPGSYESALHKVSNELKAECFWLNLDDAEAKVGALAEMRGHRAIGVVYDPSHERFGNYVPTALAKRYDKFIFLDLTTALDPLTQRFDRREIPETWPLGM